MRDVFLRAIRIVGRVGLDEIVLVGDAPAFRPAALWAEAAVWNAFLDREVERSTINSGLPAGANLDNHHSLQWVRAAQATSLRVNLRADGHAVDERIADPDGLVAALVTAAALAVVIEVDPRLAIFGADAVVPRPTPHGVPDDGNHEQRGEDCKQSHVEFLRGRGYGWAN